MKSLSWLLVIAAMSFASFSQAANIDSGTDAWKQKVGNSLRVRRNFANNRGDILVIMRDQTNLTPARMLVGKSNKGRFVVQNLRKTALQTQSGLVELLNSEKAVYRRFYIMNAIAVRGASAQLIQQIAMRSDVKKIIADPATKGPQPPRNAPRMALGGGSSGVGANIVSTGAEQVWEKFHARGQGIVVAGQDTGVQWDHPALINHYRGAKGGFAQHDFNWHDAIRQQITNVKSRCGYDLKAPCDDGDHGTHTMGTIVGDDGGDNKIGMAPDAQWIACRNMDAGTGRPSTYIECFEWFIAPYAHGQSPTQGNPALAPHVINNSWGCPESELCEGNEMAPILEAVYKAGIMTVVSAGNDGPGCGSINDQPATNSAYTFSVGAHNHRDGRIANFSSRGPSRLDGKIGPDITAPGVSIRSAVPGGKYEEAMWSGTSMAGPHVAGAVALLWSAQPKLIGNIDATIQILEQTAKPAFAPETCGGISGTARPNNTYGFGELDVLAAVTAATKLR